MLKLMRKLFHQLKKINQISFSQKFKSAVFILVEIQKQKIDQP